MLAACVVLTACGGKKAPDPTVVNVQLAASSNINPGLDATPAPVAVRLYVLGSTTAFTQADFHALISDDQGTLGEDILESEEVVVTPGQATAIQIETDEASSHFAAMAGYTDIRASVWKVSTSISPNTVNELTLLLNGNDVELVQGP